MPACRSVITCLAVGISLSLLAPVALVAQPVKEKSQESTQEKRRLRKQIEQLEREKLEIEKRLSQVPGPRGPHGPSDLDLALGAFTRLLELPHPGGWLRSKVIRTIYDVWGPRDLGLKGALDAFAAILEREGHDNTVCTIVLGAAEAMGPEAAPLLDAIQSLDTRGRPTVRDAKTRAIRSIRLDARVLNAVVQKVDQELKFVMLSIGAHDGAAKGMRFTILRDERFLGSVRVDYVYPKSCSASFVNLQPGAAFRAGDRAVYPARDVTNAASMRIAIEHWIRARDRNIEDLRRTVEKLEKEMAALKRIARRFGGPRGGLARTHHIVARVAGSNKVYINIGSRDGLRVGTRYEVFAPRTSEKVKTQRIDRKGTIRVIEVKEEYALAEIAFESDRFDPITEGDYLRMDVAPKRRRL
jgi:hypothetical protein